MELINLSETFGGTVFCNLSQGNGENGKGATEEQHFLGHF